MRLLVQACVLVLGLAPPVAAQTSLPCGGQIQRHLNASESHTYRLTSADTVMVVNVADRSSAPSLLRIRATGGIETCSGATSLVLGAGAEVEISDCIGNDEIDYTISANVVSDSAANCARDLPCGLVPRLRQWKVAGGVDAYSFQATRGDEVKLRATNAAGESGSVRVQVFDPRGNEIRLPGTCSGQVSLEARSTGLHTVLVSTCVEARLGVYRLGYTSDACPPGPEISYLGLARSDSTPVEPAGYDDSGRPIYSRVGGAGFSLVVEAKPGRQGAAPGLVGFLHDDEDPDVLPDLQILVSSPLGNGDPAVCADDEEIRDGIPATQPLVFEPTRTVADAINDFGCRVNDGTGRAFGVDDEIDACTIFSDGSIHFVHPESTAQFCAPISSARQFPVGDTIVAARVRDEAGSLGPVREMIVRIESVPTLPPSPTRTPTPPVTASPTRTPILCYGDCNGDGTVGVAEIASALASALSSAFPSCSAIDRDANGRATVDELVDAVGRGRQGCP